MEGRYSHELEIASKAVQICADLTNRLQRQLKNDDSLQKSDFSPVTIGDFAVQALLIAAIHGQFEGDVFLAEESADELRSNQALQDQVWQLVESVRSSFASCQPALKTPESKTELLELIDKGGKGDHTSDGRAWVLDPIDGTATFMQGQQYAINCTSCPQNKNSDHRLISLLHMIGAFLVDGVEQIGIIGCPNVSPQATTTHEDEVDREGLGLIIHAVRGEGTWKRPMQSFSELLPATRIPRHGDEATMSDLVWADCSTYTSTIQQLQQRVAAKLNLSWPGVDLYSSLMKYAALGLGHCSVTIRIFKYSSWRSNSWDHVSLDTLFRGQLLVQ